MLADPRQEGPEHGGDDDEDLRAVMVGAGLPVDCATAVMTSYANAKTAVMR